MKFDHTGFCMGQFDSEKCYDCSTVKQCLALKAREVLEPMVKACKEEEEYQTALKLHNEREERLAQLAFEDAMEDMQREVLLEQEDMEYSDRLTELDELIKRWP